jgi:hypothetical protein
MGFLPPFGNKKNDDDDDKNEKKKESEEEKNDAIVMERSKDYEIMKKEERKDVINDSISKGRAMLEQLQKKSGGVPFSSSSSSLKSLHVPSSKTREADALILEEKVSRMTNELNVAIREKGVAKMQLEEINGEMVALKKAFRESEEKRDEMTLRHERAAKAILGLEKRAEKAEEEIEAMKRREEELREYRDAGEERGGADCRQRSQGRAFERLRSDKSFVARERGAGGDCG